MRQLILFFFAAVSVACSAPGEPIAPQPFSPIIFGPDGGSSDGFIEESISTRTPDASQAQPEVPCDPDPPNLVLNGTFEYRPLTSCGWGTFDAADWGLAAVPYCFAADHSGCSIYLEAKVWGDDWVAQLYQRLTLEPGTRYELSFEAKAAGRTRDLLVAVLGGGPLRDEDSNLAIGAGVPVTVELDWQTFTISFVATATAGDSVLDFAFGGASSGLYLDNVSLVPAPTPDDTAD